MAGDGTGVMDRQGLAPDAAPALSGVDRQEADGGMAMAHAIWHKVQNAVQTINGLLYDMGHHQRTPVPNRDGGSCMVWAMAMPSHGRHRIHATCIPYTIPRKERIMSIAINQGAFPHAVAEDAGMFAGEGESSAEPQPAPGCIMADELDQARLTTHHIHVIGERFHLIGTDVYEADETDDLLDRASHTLRVQEALLKDAIAKHPDLLDDARARHPEPAAEGGRS